MTRLAILSRICSAKLHKDSRVGSNRNSITLAVASALAGAGLAFSTPCLAMQDKGTVTDRDPGAVDVVKTPVTDLNIDKQEIPELLIEAQRQPYDLTGLKSCQKIAAAIQELDELLGPDMDLPQEERDRISAGRVAKTVVGSLIPFRGLVREVSGANQHERRVRAAIQAGMARRGFLKGVGESHKCKYPARSASREIVASRIADMNRSDTGKEEGTDATASTER